MRLFELLVNLERKTNRILVSKCQGRNQRVEEEEEEDEAKVDKNSYPDLEEAKQEQ